MREVKSEEIKAFRPLCRKLASKYNKVGNAEFDDLEQEGMIAVWAALRNNYYPTVEFITNRLKNWISICRKKGFTE